MASESLQECLGGIIEGLPKDVLAKGDSFYREMVNQFWQAFLKHDKEVKEEEKKIFDPNGQLKVPFWSQPLVKSQMWSNFDKKVLDPTYEFLAVEKGLSSEDVVAYLSRELDSTQFQPTKKQTEALKELLRGVDVKPEKWSQWLELWSRDALYQGFDPEVANDQEKRAESLAKKMEDSHVHKIILMDGHGRLVYSLLSKIKERQALNVDSVEVTLVDIDQDVHEWHQAFMPMAKNIYGSIFDQKPSEDVVMYLNFMGLGGAGQNEKLLEWLQKYEKERSRVVLSFSARGGENPETEAKLQKDLKAHKVSGRGFFRTFDWPWVSSHAKSRLGDDGKSFWFHGQPGTRVFKHVQTLSQCHMLCRSAEPGQLYPELKLIQ